MKLLLFLINLTFAASFKSKLYNNTAIITIATGGYNANSLVSSLRNKGKWNKISILVDAKKYLSISTWN